METATYASPRTITAAAASPTERPCRSKKRVLISTPPALAGVTRFAAAAANCTNTLRPSGSRRPAASERDNAENK
jgi:hypothetical protein